MDKVTSRLAAFKKDMAAKSSTMLGYPINTSRDYRPLYDLLDYALINLGDPFVPSSWRINSEKFELEVLDFFFRLYQIPRAERWGYLTSGGTEGNTYGIFVGRQLYPDGLLYFSKDTHYSIGKIARLLQIETVLIESQANGEIDYQDLENQLQKNRQRPAIINLNLGTTMRGAVDDVAQVVSILARQKIKQFHLHCDASSWSEGLKPPSTTSVQLTAPSAAVATATPQSGSGTPLRPWAGAVSLGKRELAYLTLLICSSACWTSAGLPGATITPTSFISKNRQPRSARSGSWPWREISLTS
jgi:hypothetical protein